MKPLSFLIVISFSMLVNENVKYVKMQYEIKRFPAVDSS